MSNHFSHTSPAIRKLWKRDLPEITQHFLRLDHETRRLRFGTSVSDDFIRTYAKRILDIGSMIVGTFPDGQLRAVGELRGLYQPSPFNAELALSVESGWQSQGIGSALFSRLMTAAQNRRIRSLYVLFRNENKRMCRIVVKHHPKLEFHGGEVEATLDPPWPTPLSIAHEVVEEINAYIRRALMLTIWQRHGSRIPARR